MAFIIDSQTISDLGIFGKPGAESVYSIFNRTCTSGGAAILEEMFSYPLSNKAAIDERIKIFEEFEKLSVAFSFSTDLFGLAEQYLNNTDQRTRLTHEQQTIGKKIVNLINSDTEYKNLVKGVVAVKDIISELWQFLKRYNFDQCRSLAADREAILALLNEVPFREMVEQKKGHVPDEFLASYDAVFRFKKRPAIRQMLQFIYRTDVFVAVAKTVKERKFCFPVTIPDDESGLKIENVHHLLVNSAVPNSIVLGPGKNMVFLTGANMAGKSTLMKTVGIAVFLAHAGFPVPASSMEFSVMDGLFTTINLADNLASGTSHFYAEVLRVKKVAKELSSSKKMFVIFDELFRGTNVKDAYEATVAIISAFATKKNSMFIISTHIIEAGEVLKQKCPDIQCIYLPTMMEGNTPRYTYQLREGITNDRHGMIIIQNEGILKILSSRKTQQHELYSRHANIG